MKKQKTTKFNYLSCEKIAFAGRQRSGKDFLALVWKHFNKQTSNKECSILRLAAPVYQIHEYIQDNFLNVKYSKKKNRKALQAIGTEVGRKAYHSDIWIDYLLTKIPVSKMLVGIPDVRFKNEVKILKNNGFRVCWVWGKHGRRESIFHRSELELLVPAIADTIRTWIKLKPKFFDGIIFNKLM